jgi:hypothetical protein
MGADEAVGACRGGQMNKDAENKGAWGRRRGRNARYSSGFRQDQQAR